MVGTPKGAACACCLVIVGSPMRAVYVPLVVSLVSAGRSPRARPPAGTGSDSHSFHCQEALVKRVSDKGLNAENKRPKQMGAWCL